MIERALIRVTGLPQAGKTTPISQFLRKTTSRTNGALQIQA
jgi:hypothetical protein